MRDIAYKALTAREKLSRKLQREATVDEIAKELELKKENIVMALDSIQDPVSLFEPVYNDDGDPIYVMDQIKDKKYGQQMDRKSVAVRSYEKAVSQREQHILTMRFFEGKT